jgi:hypothetical protein
VAFIYELIDLSKPISLVSRVPNMFAANDSSKLVVATSAVSAALHRKSLLHKLCTKNRLRRAFFVQDGILHKKSSTKGGGE